MLKKGPERIFFFRGVAVGSVMMAAVSMGADFVAGNGYFQAGSLSATPEGKGASPAEQAAAILSQALTLSDKMMNRTIAQEDISLIVTGALRALDPYSGYVEKELTDRITKGNQILTDHYMIGILGDISEKGYFVRSTMPLSPAEGSGILFGDKLVSINGDDVSSLPGSDALSRLREATNEAAGMKMKLGFERKNDVFYIEIAPEPLAETFAYDMGVVDGNLHILIKGFFNGISEDVGRIIERNVQKGIVRGVIFDLRGNSGGLTEETRKVAELVMPKGTLLYTETGLHIGEMALRTEVDPKYPDLKMAVLIDEGSASASEIFASAMQANELGVVVGRISFGKGTIQNVYPFIDGRGAIKITVGEYRDPKGRAINRVGVFPDVLIDAVTKKVQQDDPAFDAAVKALENFNG